MMLYDLLAAANIEELQGIQNIDIKRIHINTEQAINDSEKNILFICIKGANYDTHEDIQRLLDNGIFNIISEKSHDTRIIKTENTRKALALISRAFYGFPDKELIKVAITGTKGKTTVSYMLHEILSEAGIPCGIIGTNGIIYNGETYDCENSTPGSMEFYYHLRKMVDIGVTHVLCEVTSQALKQFRTFGTKFNTAVFTNLYPDHIGRNEHDNFEEYKSCKLRLFSCCENAVINLDSDFSRDFINECNNNAVGYKTYSSSCSSADVYCKKESSKCNSSDFTVNKTKFTINLPGEFNISNALCSILVAEQLGVELKYILSGLEKVKIPGRCEKVENPCGVNIIIDYAHTGESLKSILQSLKKNCKGKLYVLFGAGGDRSRLRRSGMGEAASEYADFSVITSDNPRSENRNIIICDILTGVKGKNYIVIPEREDAIKYLLSVAKKGDTVLLAGKGVQNYQEINGVKYPFDERIAVAEFYKNNFRK